MSNFCSIKPGVISSQELHKIFLYIKKKNIALAAINCFDTNSINSVLEAAKKYNTLVVIQFSFSGSIFFVGENYSLFTNKTEAAIRGAILGAQYVHEISKYYKIPVILHTDHCSKDNLLWIDSLLQYNKDYYESYGQSLFTSHMLDMSNCNIKENLYFCKKYLYKMSCLNINLELELGCTGGEEDGLDNSNISNNKLYTNPKDVLLFYSQLTKISSYFTIAASFGNTHGVYRPGNIVLSPVILYNSQKLVKKTYNILNKKPLNFVFHGGSGTSVEIIKESIKYGVIKINLDTDIQWSLWNGVLNYYNNNKEYLKSQLGNPSGLDKPNKKFYDPRVWLRCGQRSVVKYLKKIFYIFNCIDLLLNK